MTEQKHIVIIGGGLAGIAVASALSLSGRRVTLLEAKQQLGGRATSYTDQQSGEVIDNCQHVSMGCCTNLKHLCDQLGLADDFTTEKALYFVSLDGRITKFAESLLPAPFHLTSAFLRLPYLSPLEKTRFAIAIRALAKSHAEDLNSQNFYDWLIEHQQTDNLIRNVWEVVLISALSESLDRIDASYARKVFVDGFLSNRSGWRVEIPTTSLEALYSEKTVDALWQNGVNIEFNARVSAIHVQDAQVQSLTLRDGRTIEGDEFVVAVPQHQVLNLLPAEITTEPTFQKLNEIESAPITSVHLWFDRPIMDLPHAVMLERLSQWAFARGTDYSSPPRYCYQVVISASRNLETMTHQEIVDAVWAELAAVWKECCNAELMHSRVITERRAVFSVTPGINELRPPQQSPLPNLQFAGDWTQTGWPATMEGAVLSGYLAAENILKRSGTEEHLAQPGLPVSWLSRLLLGIR